MQNYLINWTAKDHKKTIGHFEEHAGSLQTLVATLGAAGITIKQSWHMLGQNRGMLIVSVDSPIAIHTAAVKLADVVGLEIVPVLKDKEALAALAQAK